ncbi:uncharacterized protein LOC107264174 [Cephus cinctus]|uniref:Uncharacterized protein LOC107264174 n=1 Tax=Cephus cinctus TaxID=211228 RepID=A0AAJ7BJJ3_CEPCN|nr:uncharacterized protein LOC107264174 [Cephus cinctus]XP_015587645.1 uncharacterized protein LOC107264174 [Cephus cinctus]
MTFKSLMNFGGFSGTPSTAMDRYHSGPSGSYDHGYKHSYKGSGKGGSGHGSGAALSALTLLAFLFLINVMQQSMQDTNSTTTATILLREETAPLTLSARDNEKSSGIKVDSRTHVSDVFLVPVKTANHDSNNDN